MGENTNEHKEKSDLLQVALLGAWQRKELSSPWKYKDTEQIGQRLSARIYYHSTQSPLGWLHTAVLASAVNIWSMSLL